MRFRKRLKNKYKAQSTKCWQGHYHPSKLEAGYCDQLGMVMKTGDIKSYKTQVKYSMDINGLHICNHYVDFEVERKDGSIECHETKGCETDIWRIKHRLFLALYPDIPYLVIK